MSSLAVGRELEDLELWLGGLFTAAELAAADLLLQLSAAGAGGDDDEAAESSSSATTYSSRRSASPCLHGLAADEEEVERVVEETAPLPLGSMELDRRARKRYRLLSDLYAATVPVTSEAAAADSRKNKMKKRKGRHHSDGFGSSSSSEVTRYGGGY